MVAINFQSQFAELVADGVKTQTIRRPRSRPFRAGDELQLYTGMRTSRCRLLARARCTEVRRLGITPEFLTLEAEDGLETVELRSSARHLFARSDGFESWESLTRWFDATWGLPFRGVLIRWEVT
jgi:hypothetical protein